MGTFSLGHLRDARLRVRQSFEVDVEECDDGFIAEASQVCEYGYGNTWSEAVADLQNAIAELYFLLESETANLGKVLQQNWEVLQGMVEKRK